MPAVECWDDDVDLQGNIFAPSVSTAHSNLSSRVSARSESIAGEEDWQVLISPNDAHSTANAISSANQVGIPIPKNVPSSALLGGAIKRLGKKKSRQDVSDDWGDDFDVADTGMASLKLRKPVVFSPPPQGNATDQEEFDSEWAEGSLGIRFAGTRRDTRGRSSSVSAMSPSMGSCMTLESEDDELGGLVLPNEPIDFNHLLKKRKAVDYDTPTSVPAPPQPPPAQRHSAVQKPTLPADEDDIMTGLEIDGAELFDAKKRKINRNVKVKQPPKPTPTLRTSASLTFTDKISGSSRIPRPTPPQKTANKLDTVPESQSPSVTARQLNRVPRQPPTTTGAQLLRSKRSAPVLGSRQIATPSSRPPVPFLPAGVAPTQSHHVTAKSGSYHHRQASDHHDRPMSPTGRTFSRPNSAAHHNTDNTPSRAGFRKDAAPISLVRQATNQRTLQLKKGRNFGDGSELDRFDDLPTSATKENKFVKAPANRTQPKTLRSTQSRRNLVGSSEPSVTPVPPSVSSASSTVPTTPLAPPTPQRGYFPHDNTPRFARDTAASRNAREQRLGNNARPRGSGPIEAVAINWKAQVAARSPQTSPSAQRIRKKGDAKRPQLITNMGQAQIKSMIVLIFLPYTRRC
jgi:hypothetical protein